MIVPPIGGLAAGEASVGQAQASAGGITQSQGPGAAQGASVTGAEGQVPAAGAPEAAAGVAEGGGFGGALVEAISSLEQTQRSADQAAQTLATGTAKNPESAVVTVEDAQLAMQLASQIRTRATDAVQTIFQTQV